MDNDFPLGYNKLVLTFDFTCPQCKSKKVIVHKLHSETLDCICSDCLYSFEESL
jgi:DNA-directed RNA polymerase subunit M/transcription elongation factor TFIIS